MKLLSTVMWGNKLYYNLQRLYMTSFDCSSDVNLLFVLIKYAKMFYFVPLVYIDVVGIQVEKTRGNPHEKYRGVPKGGVIKGV